MNNSLRDQKSYERGCQFIIEKLNCGFSKKDITDNLPTGNCHFMNGCEFTMIHNFHTKLYYELFGGNIGMCITDCPHHPESLIGSLKCYNCKYHIFMNSYNPNHTPNRYVICSFKEKDVQTK